MCKRSSFFLVITGLAGLLFAAAMAHATGPSIPQPGHPPDEAVSFKTVQEVCANLVRAYWPTVEPGPVIPYCDYDGATIAYMFHFRIDGKPFPADYDQVVREDREDINGFQHAPHVAPPSGKFRYAHVLVSARADRTPLIAWGEGLSEFYRTGLKAQSQAAGLLGDAHPVLCRMYFTWPVTYFVFEAAGRTIVMHANLVTQVRSEADYVAACRVDETGREAEARARLAQKGKTEADLLAEARRRCDREWLRALSPRQDLAPVYVLNYQKAPFYDWSFGCSPTSGAMLFGWFDEACHDGRLIDWHYQRWDTVQREMDYNVPNAQLELATSMSTDTMNGSTGGASIGPGLYDAVARLNNYSATWFRWYYYETSNWCWDEVVATINAGCPVEWSAHPVGGGGHSLACFGYDAASSSFFVHNTWAPPGEFWHYTGGGAYDWTQADYVSPNPLVNTYVHIYNPVGDTGYNSNGHGATVHAWSRLPIILTATAGDSWKLYYSKLGGKPGSWVYWDKGLGHPTTIYKMVTDTLASDAARLQIVLYTAGQNTPYSASDGLWGNFRIVAEAPPAPVLVWPYNNGFLHSKFPTMRPNLYLNAISYAREYDFQYYNDSLPSVVESGWQADTLFNVGVLCPVGSHGWWQAKARNPTGESPWSSKSSYSIVGDSAWMPKRRPPMLSKKKPKKGGCVMHKKKKMNAGLAATDDTLYLLVGNNTREFLRYSVWNDSWSHADSLPPGPRDRRVKNGATMLSDTSFCYAFKGGGTNEFYRYDPGADAWTELPGPYFARGLRNGFSALVQVGGEEYIYAGSGWVKDEWARYRVATRTWEPLGMLPSEKTKAGTSICWDGGQVIYLLAGGNLDNEFFGLRTDQMVWTRLGELPLAGPSGKRKKVKEGGGLEFFQGKVYAVKGGNTREFWCYDPNLVKWRYVGEVGQGSGTIPTKGILCAKPLAATDDGMFCIVGNNTDDFFFWGGDTVHGAMSWHPGDGTSSNQVNGVRNVGLFINPNPCSRAATIAYSLPGPGKTSLRLYDVTGKLVSTLVDGYRPAGNYCMQLTVNGLRQELAAGIYVLRLDSDGGQTTAKLIIE